MTYVGAVHKDKEGMAAATKEFRGTVKQGEREMALGAKEFGFVWFRLLSRGLQEGWMTGHSFEVVKGCLGGLGDRVGGFEGGEGECG